MGRRVLFERLTIAALVSTFVLICVGAYVVKIGAGQACPTWPQCFDTEGGNFVDRWFPFAHADETGHIHGWPANMVAAEWIHRFIAGAVTFLTIGVVATAWRLRPVDTKARTIATLAGVFLFTQIILGGVTVLLANAPWTVVLHQGNAMLVFGCFVALATLALTSPARGLAPASAPSQAPVEPSGREPGPMTSRPWTGRLQKALGPWVELVKPGILLLLVMCGAAAMFLAGRPSLRLVLATLAGGGLAACSAAALNNYFDRERDAKMARTKKRSLPSARIAPWSALVFAFALESTSFAILWTNANLLTAMLALAGIAFYVFYTVWLKPTTAQNIVIGGAAGAAPALVGWAAVTGDLGLPALILGFIIFAWTPPHFWALALVYKKDYEGGEVPMLPVTAGESATRKQILVYAVLTVLATLAFVPLGVLGVVYAVAAVVLGAWFVALSVRLLLRKDNKTAYGLFAYSIVYLALLFAAMVADRLIMLR